MDRLGFGLGDFYFFFDQKGKGE
jgi:hypothetical protein